MNKLIQYSIKHPTSIFMYYILLIIAGVVSLFTIPMDFLPEIKDHVLLVSTVFPGMSADQMQKVVTIPVETSLSSLKGIKNISSVSRDNCSFIKLELHDSININKAIIETQQIIDQLQSSLPQKCCKPEVDTYTSDKNTIIKFAVTSSSKTIPQLHSLVNDELRHTLQTAEGIGKISISGGSENEIHILYDPFKLYSLNLTPELISDAIINTNYEYPAGLIKDGNNEYILKTSGQFKTINDIENVKIKANNKILDLKELCTISFIQQDINTFSFYNTNECIYVSIQKKSNSNPISTVTNIKKILSSFCKNYPSVNISVVKDESIEIKQSIISVLGSALLSSLLTYFVIFFFFKNKTVSLFLSLPIPLCILFAITCLRVTGHSANLFSLSGISISIGMLVDASIVVLENLLSKHRTNISDKDIMHAATEVKTSTINSTLTTIIVFTPLFFFKGNFGELFSDLAISVISSIFLSGLIALTLVPALYKVFFLRCNSIISEISLLNKIIINYKSKLNLILLNRKFYLTVFLILCVSIIPLLFLVKKQFSPPVKSSEFSFLIDLPPNQSMTKSKHDFEKLLNKLHSTFPSLETLVSAGIEPSDFIKLSDIKLNPNSTILAVKIKKLSITSKLEENIIKFLNENGISFQKIENKDFITKSLDIESQFIFSFDNFADYCAFSKKNTDAIPCYKSIEQQFIPDELKLMHYKIPNSYISQYVYSYLQGINSGTFKQENKEIKIVVKPDNTDYNIEEILIPFINQTIPLSSLGTLKLSEQDKVLFRYNKKDSKILNNNNLDVKALSTSKEKFHELSINAILLLSFVLILLYCLLGAQLESFYAPIILLISIVPGFTGSLLALVLTFNSLNINSLLSLIILSGIAINNSIILLEAVTEKKNLSRTKFIDLISLKLRPILITTITSILSLTPFIFINSGNSSQQSMSVALCGGLILSVFSSLFFVPIFIYKQEVK